MVRPGQPHRPVRSQPQAQDNPAAQQPAGGGYDVVQALSSAGVLLHTASAISFVRTKNFRDPHENRELADIFLSYDYHTK